MANLMTPTIPMPEIETELQDFIYNEMRSQAHLSEKQLPSIGSINLLNSNRQVNSVALSDTGDLLAVGNADSTIKVFWLNKASLLRSLGGSEASNPFAEQEDPTQILN